MGVLLNSIKPCFNWKASLHFPIIWSKLKADAHSLIRSLISVPGNQNSLSLLGRDSFANCTQFQRFSKENLSMQSVNCHSVNNCLNIQTTQQLPIKKTCGFPRKQWRPGATHRWRADGLCSEHWGWQCHQTAPGGKGQKPCDKPCFLRSALLSKKLASKVLIGRPKINPFNEWVNWFRMQTWKNQREQTSQAICCF